MAMPGIIALLEGGFRRSGHRHAEIISLRVQARRQAAQQQGCTPGSPANHADAPPIIDRVSRPNRRRRNDRNPGTIAGD